MRRGKLVIFLILSGSIFSCGFVRGEPYDELLHEDTNMHIDGALPGTISFGNLLPETSENEIVIGTSKNTLLVMNYYLDTIFSLNLSSNAKKTIIDQVDENLQETRGLFVLTEDGKIQLYEGYGTRKLLLTFPTPLSDFIVMNTDEDSQKEIVLINDTNIEAYDLTGEKIWDYQGEDIFKKLVHSKRPSYLGGIFAFTSNSVYLFSFNGGYIFDVEVGNIRDFLLREDEVFVLACNNQILRIGINNPKPERIYPNKENETNFEYISSIHLAGDNIAIIGQGGKFQILQLSGRIVGEDDLESEIVSFSYSNLDYDREIYFPAYNSYIRSLETMIATQKGEVYIYPPDFKKKSEKEIEPQEYYEIDKEIRYATIVPSREEKIPQKLLIVDIGGRLYSYTIFYYYCDVLGKYNSGVGQYSIARYQESERSLKQIADKQGINERIDKNREILKYYGLLEDAEEYLRKARVELLKPKKEGEAMIERGYSAFNSDSPDYEKAIDPLFEAYLKFKEANIDGGTEVYGSKTLNDLMIDIRICIFHLLEEADTYLKESEHEKALDYFLNIYPKMKELMGNPEAETGSTEKLKPFGKIAEEYKSSEVVKENIKKCMAELEKMSQSTLEDGNLKESRRLNDKLISAASTIGVESEEYHLRDEKITAIEHARNIKYIIYTVLSVAIVLISIFIIKVKKRYDTIKSDVLLHFDSAVDKFAHKIAETPDFKDIFGLDEIFDYWSNFKAYIILFIFERDMRTFIRDKLEENFGDTWEKEALRGESFKEARKRRNLEMSGMPARDLSEVTLLDYCDFPDLNVAIQANWELFETFFGRREDLKVRFDNLYSLRKIVAHARELSDPEFSDVLSHTRWFFERIY